MPCNSSPQLKKMHFFVGGGGGVEPENNPIKVSCIPEDLNEELFAEGKDSQAYSQPVTSRQLIHQLQVVRTDYDNFFKENTIRA